MEKFGVVYDDGLTKEGAQTGDKKCPKCGAKLDKPNWCKNCGTEPFEKMPPDKKER